MATALRVRVLPARVAMVMLRVDVPARVAMVMLRVDVQVRVVMVMLRVGVQVRVVMVMLRVTANPTASAMSASHTVIEVSASLTVLVRRVRVLPARVAMAMLRVGDLVRVVVVMLRVGDLVRVVVVMLRVTANPTACAVSASLTVSEVNASLTVIVRRVRVLVARVATAKPHVDVQVLEPVVRVAMAMLRVGVQVRGAMIAAVRFEKRSLSVL